MLHHKFVMLIYSSLCHVFIILSLCILAEGLVGASLLVPFSPTWPFLLSAFTCFPFAIRICVVNMSVGILFLFLSLIMCGLNGFSHMFCS